MYHLKVVGYWGKNAYKAGEKKITMEACFLHEENAINKKNQFEKWAEINNIPPYDITIDEIPDNPSLAEDL